MTIASLFSPELKNFLQKIEDLGFQLTLVGGAPRDYLLDRSFLSFDLDFELRGKLISELVTFLKFQNILYTELPYNIIRIGWHGFDLEFSSPRIEKALTENKTHHHFIAELNPTLEYKEAFKRRDFSINAIGIELSFKNNSESIVDPYDGISALMSKTLKELSSDFFLDSVRFLRLLRFMIKYNFEMSSSIEAGLYQFDLSELSAHHFKSEMIKSGKPGIFVNAFNNLTSIYNLETPKKFEVWKNLKYLPDIENIEDLLVDTFLQNEKSANKVADFLSIPTSKIKDLKSFHESINKIKQTSKEEFIKIAELPLNKVSNLEILKNLKNLEDKKEWKSYSNDKLLISWSDWENIQANSTELDSTPAELRSYIKYHKALKKVFT